MTIDAAFTDFPTLTTDRLRLRQIQPSDAEPLYAILSDPQVMQYYGSEPYQTLADAQTAIMRGQTRYAEREALRWAITRQGDDRFIGSCVLNHFDPDFHHAETGYELDRASWGQGIMHEAMATVLTFGFTELALHRIEAQIDMQNARSKGLLLKLGFTYEGNLRQRFYFRGRFEDEYYFGLLKDEWLGKTPVTE